MRKSTFFAFIFLLILLLISSITAYGQSTYISRTSANGVKIVKEVNFDDCEVLQTKGSQIRFEVTVNLVSDDGGNLPSNRKALLTKYLAEQGRYQLVMTEDRALEELEVSPPKNADVLISKSYGNIKEEISVKVFVPEGIFIKIDE